MLDSDSDYDIDACVYVLPDMVSLEGNTFGSRCDPVLLWFWGILKKESQNPNDTSNTPSQPRFAQAGLSPYHEAEPWLAEYLKQVTLSGTALPKSREAFGAVTPTDTPAYSSIDPMQTSNAHHQGVARERMHMFVSEEQQLEVVWNKIGASRLGCNILKPLVVDA